MTTPSAPSVNPPPYPGEPYAAGPGYPPAAAPMYPPPTQEKSELAGMHKKPLTPNRQFDVRNYLKLSGRKFVYCKSLHPKITCNENICRIPPPHCHPTHEVQACFIITCLYKTNTINSMPFC